ncbi:MAG: PAS domain S-box protein [Deltaproteobacteria bacterium]|nr:PAS domain S-box protein [Deltaproteobacteria bacterium]
MKLRHRAEALLREGPEGLKEAPVQDIQNIIHELQVHHIELEMQNEELRRTQLELHAERNKYAGLYDFAPVGYFTINKKGMITEANLTAAALFETERGRLIGQPLSRFIDKDDQETFYFHRKKLSEAKTKQTYELMLLKKDKSQFHAQMACIPVRDKNGTFAHIRAAVTDITDRKQAEEALRKAHDELERRVEERTAELVKVNEQLKIEMEDRKQAEETILKSAEKYRSLVEFTEDSIYLVDRDGTYLFVNEKHLSRLGSPADKVIGTTYGDFHLIDDTREFEERIEEVFETGQTTQHEHRSLRDDRYFLRTLSPVKTPDGSTTSVTVVSKDITERKRSEEAMLRSEKLASLGQFSAGLAHELRNPLAVISSCSQFCLESRQPEHLVKKNFQVIYRSGQKASHLINELLAFARPAHLEYSDVDINPLITRMLKMAQLEVRHNRITFAERLDKGLPKVYGDEGKLGQVFLNLLQNAIYAVSHQREITIETGLPDPGNYLEVNITDDGPGIPHDDLCRIFDPFFTTKDGGTGLGLSICHAIMEQHQGSISVECGKEKRTRMTVRLPVRGVKADARTP